MNLGYVYFAKFGERLKVGHANSLAQRFSSHVREQSEPVTFLFAVYGGLSTEADIHDRLKAYRVKGVRSCELFELTREEIEDIQNHFRTKPGYTEELSESNIIQFPSMRRGKSSGIRGLLLDEVRNEPFDVQWRWSLLRSDLSATAKLVALVLQVFADEDNFTNPSAPMVATAASLGQSTVKMAFAELRASGYVWGERSRGRVPTVYELRIPGHQPEPLRPNLVDPTPERRGLSTLDLYVLALRGAASKPGG